MKYRGNGSQWMTNSRRWMLAREINGPAIGWCNGSGSHLPIIDLKNDEQITGETHNPRSIKPGTETPYLSRMARKAHYMISKGKCAYATCRYLGHHRSLKRNQNWYRKTVFPSLRRKREHHMWQRIRHRPFHQERGLFIWCMLRADVLLNSAVPLGEYCRIL